MKPDLRRNGRHARPGQVLAQVHDAKNSRLVKCYATARKTFAVAKNRRRERRPHFCRDVSAYGSKVGSDVSLNVAAFGWNVLMSAFGNIGGPRVRPTPCLKSR